MEHIFLFIFWYHFKKLHFETNWRWLCKLRRQKHIIKQGLTKKVISKLEENQLKNLLKQFIINQMKANSNKNY